MYPSQRRRWPLKVIHLETQLDILKFILTSCSSANELEVNDLQDQKRKHPLPFISEDFGMLLSLPARA